MSPVAVVQTQCPQPLGIGNAGALAARLDELRCWSGVSIRALHRRIVAQRRCAGVVEVPSYNTVWRCLQPDRARLDTGLVTDMVRALTADESAVALWRQACTGVVAGQGAAQIVQTGAVLRPAEASFIGRDHAVAAIVAAGRENGPALFRIDGMAGVGKSWLAFEAARMLQVRHAGAVLTAALRGYDLDQPPADPDAVLGEFLRHLGVEPHVIATLDRRGRVARYRSLLSERRTLVVLDDAVDEAQIRPLLPLAQGSVTLVTSRRRLSGLPGRRIGLGVFTLEESRSALGAILGRGRPDVDALDDLAAAAGHLPLAVAVVGSHVNAHPGWSMRDHLDRLTAGVAAGRIDLQVDRALTTSYRALGSEEQTLARMLALHPGRFDAWSAAALAGTDVRSAGMHLEALGAANVVAERDGGFGLHDLFRIFLATRSWDEDAPAVRQGAWNRLVDYYLAAAVAAAQASGAEPDPAGSDAERADRAGIQRPEFGDAEAARRWLSREQPTLLAVALRDALVVGRHPAVVLAAALARHLGVSGQYREARMLHERAVAVATGVDLARALSCLGGSEWRLGDVDSAYTHTRRGVALARRLGDGVAEIGALTNLGIVYGGQQRWDQALASHRRAVRVAQHLGATPREAKAQYNLGYVHETLGQHEAAADHFAHALRLAELSGDDEVIGQAGLGLARVHESRGNYDEAAALAREHLAASRRAGLRVCEAAATAQLGRLSRLSGDIPAAVELTSAALSFAHESGYRAMQIELEEALVEMRALPLSPSGV